MGKWETSPQMGDKHGGHPRAELRRQVAPQLAVRFNCPSLGTTLEWIHGFKRGSTGIGERCLGVCLLHHQRRRRGTGVLTDLALISHQSRFVADKRRDLHASVWQCLGFCELHHLGDLAAYGAIQLHGGHPHGGPFWNRFQRFHFRRNLPDQHHRTDRYGERSEFQRAD